MTTGGKLIQAALRDPMSQVGWTPRAAGWYTRSVAAGAFGVLAVGVASEHSAPGEATATIYVHFRDEQLELAVADVAGSREQGYKTTTATTSIGYLMPAARWCEWNVSAENVDAIAAEMADAVRTYAEPHLRALVADPQLLLAAIASSPSYATSTGLARAVLLMRRTGRSLEAVNSLDDGLRDWRRAPMPQPRWNVTRSLRSDGRRPDKPQGSAARRRRATPVCSPRSKGCSMIRFRS